MQHAMNTIQQVCIQPLRHVDVCQEYVHTETDMHQVTADQPTISICMACAKASGDGLHKKPVIPCCTLSVGPPLSQAMTGLPDAMASKGTMPKCSFCGV